MLKHFTAYLSCDGSVEGRQLFLTINKSSHPSSPSNGHTHRHTSLHHVHVPNCTANAVDTASVTVVIQPVPDSVLVQATSKNKGISSTFDYTRHDSLEAEIELRRREPLPFSSKRSMLSTGKVAQVYGTHMLYNKIITILVQDQLSTDAEKSD